jgi:hypothetical protein
MPFTDFLAPFIPGEPSAIRNVRDIEDIYRWAVDLRRELDRFLTEVHRQGATKSLVGTRAETTVTAGFTLTAEDAIICLSSATPVISSTTTALNNGTDGQWVILVNAGTQQITVKHGANTYLALAADVGLRAKECLFLVWTGSIWLELSLGSMIQSLREGISTQALQITSLTPNTLVKTDADSYLASDPTNYIIGDGVNTITVGTTAPSTPIAGDLFFDSDDTSVVAGTDPNTVTLSETGITLAGTATVWLDSMVSPFTARTAAANLALQAFVGGLYFPRYDLNDEIFGSIQFNHQIKVTGTVTIYPHIHLVNKNAIGVVTYEVAFQFEWAWGNIGSTGLDSATNDPLTFSFSGASAYTHKMFNFTAITATAAQGGISSILVFRLKRVTSGTAAAYDTNDVFFGGFDVHYECDTIGSNTDSAK